MAANQYFYYLTGTAHTLPMRWRNGPEIDTSTCSVCQHTHRMSCNPLMSESLGRSSASIIANVLQARLSPGT
ncbi:hypothetical protein DPMN_019316 [Dreissena polymorpha]|uniref:Uncharacterized protein n=1 Tax=Dreissena polymorpha TaxID=45954 RepID=A0A9D4S835_DREPO|nr:hypothetical protein DPMN_019316 [Dreissena polymorpha]